ncbi:MULTISPECIES: hypothetical protein [Bacillota]|jgi:hypothetical protein|uniref:hypothetical protein n=1 Tax=Bacillota TaxID=1239 RepID=UPI00289DF408|nr:MULTISPECIES: hypothetical protein [Bacillota]
MFKKVLGLTAAVVVVLGLASVSLAKIGVEKIISNPVYAQTSVTTNNSSYSKYDMIETMRNNGFSDIADDLENGDYKAMDDFMNTLTEEDYQKMIDLMRETNPGMADMMEGIGREQMIEMHNAMGGAGGCHGNNRNNGNDEFEETKTVL